MPKARRFEHFWFVLLSILLDHHVHLYIIIGVLATVVVPVGIVWSAVLFSQCGAVFLHTRSVGWRNERSGRFSILAACHGRRTLRTPAGADAIFAAEVMLNCSSNIPRTCSHWPPIFTMRKANILVPVCLAYDHRLGG